SVPAKRGGRQPEHTRAKSDREFSGRGTFGYRGNRLARRVVANRPGCRSPAEIIEIFGNTIPTNRDRLYGRTDSSGSDKLQFVVVTLFVVATSCRQTEVCRTSLIEA